MDKEIDLDFVEKCWALDSRGTAECTGPNGEELISLQFVTNTANVFGIVYSIDEAGGKHVD